MRSSSGVHFIALDHVRALAAFMVIAYHFIHGVNGYPVPFNYGPAIFPFSILDEGNTGVALFMTLSGYLFAKLLNGKSINYTTFLWNRVLRLIPLLLVVILIVGILHDMPGEDNYSYVELIAMGALLPTLPNGGWSITVEFHYYLILPIFLWMLRKSKLLPISIIIAALTLRFFLYQKNGQVQDQAYWTIIGRIDQFALGMIIYQFRAFFARRHILAIAILTGFTLFYRYFDLFGGLSSNLPDPSQSPIWIILPTIEGLAYAVGIAWYESSFTHSTTGVSKFIGRIGEYSYSIYLLQFFVVFHAAKFVHERIMDISNFYLACLWSVIFFLLMMPAGYLSFRFIESPFLKLRKPYVVAPQESRSSRRRTRPSPG
jgi:peptidoglycan/LPS O-acetylase OafA/YrhL